MVVGALMEIDRFKRSVLEDADADERRAALSRLAAADEGKQSETVHIEPLDSAIGKVRNAASFIEGLTKVGGEPVSMSVTLTPQELSALNDHLKRKG